MATANKKVYVSPGVYTSETDLSFVAQSIGVTTLGLVGETLKGPAFEPIFITNYDEFQTFFGGTEPSKFINTQIPKYEAAYIAKSYLQQSNQLFVTRILGLSGYDAGPSWSIKVTSTGSTYDNMVVATIRSRGISLYGGSYHGQDYLLTGTSQLELINTGQYSASTTSPLETFLLSGNTVSGDTFSFEVSLDAASPQFITKVLGTSNFDKSRFDVPIFVEEVYPNALRVGYLKGEISGITSSMVALPDARSEDETSIAYKVEKYQSPVSPWLVSDLKGNKVYKLFRFVSISDGDAANFEVKISIANLSFNNMTFDVLIRDFYDEDANPIVLEKFTNCTMDPDSNNYIAKRIGTTNGEYSLLSRFVMIEMSTEAPIDALPCGFYGYTQRIYDTTTNVSPIPTYKTKYYYAGEVIYSGSPLGDIESTGDLVRRSYLGFSTQPEFSYDLSFFGYKGKKNPSTWVSSPLVVEAAPWNYLSIGFHMDSGASGITIPNEYVTSGTPAFSCGSASFTEDPQTQENPYYYIYSRKFTLCFEGGFDGWDAYREFRTNEDRFQLGGLGFLAGSAPSTRYPSATGGDSGLFKRITVENNSTDFANTDFYAYLLGVLTFNNPESTNINVFATTGFDYVNNRALAEQTIDMIQFQRADSVYIATTPDYNMYTPVVGDAQEVIYPQDAVNNLEDSGIDSNYTSTYYPWILVRDTVNNTQIYIPPTGEVCRNLALTDNIAFPWFASAGYTRGLVNSVKARLKLTQEDRDTLYQGRINPIATFSDVGTVIWGNKTLQVADSALNRLNVRRLLLQARKLISAVAIRLLFEQNDQIVRQQFLDSVNPILDGIRRDRGLYDFRVTVSSSPEDLDRNTLTGKIYLKPTKALEFIDIEFFITPTGASFENI